MNFILDTFNQALVDFVLAILDPAHFQFDVSCELCFLCCNSASIAIGVLSPDMINFGSDSCNPRASSSSLDLAHHLV